MTLKSLLRMFSDNSCDKVYVKELVKNNNSKQQIYLARGDIQILNVFPVDVFKAEVKGNAKKATFHAKCTFFWINGEGNKHLAPQAKFILYPDYPEVRFSGFIKGCTKAPSDVLNHKVAGRFLFFGVTTSGQIIGYAADANSEIANEFLNQKNLPRIGILYFIALETRKIIHDTRTHLLLKLKEIQLKGWIVSKQLKPGPILKPCNEGRCGGLTLEAELGIIQNGRSEPDYLGWEIKQFGVKKLHLINSSRITLMTPEPDGGFYREQGGIQFVKKYGYMSESNLNRMDFTGYHKFRNEQKKSKLTLEIEGYDFSSNEITDPCKGICLLDGKGNIAASWSFEKMLTHWTKKHAQAAYVPSLSRLSPDREYMYSNNIILGEGTDYTFFIKNIANGNIFYDPGIHIDNISSSPTLKPRSQFRISSKFIKELYKKVEVIDLNNV